MSAAVVVVLVVITALIFDFTNGFHDTANAMATSIATGALRPKVAVAISAVLNIAGAFLAVKVAQTISSGIVDDTKITAAVVFGGLVGAILWNLVTWLLGLPSSSTHALIGGLIGATWISAGTGAIHLSTVVSKVLVPLVLSPVLAGLIALLATFLGYRATARARQDVVRKGFRTGQAVSASLVSLAHGTGDAQKTMGVITLVLIISGTLPAGSAPPVWVILAAGASMGLGTYLGGWRVIRTVGHRITNIDSPQGFTAETSSAAVILASSHLGFALSTTQVTSGAVLGSGLGRRLAQVRWGTVGRMAIAWLLTLPAAAFAGALASRLAVTGGGGTAAVAVIGAAVGGSIYLASRRDPITAGNVNDNAAPRPRHAQPVGAR